MSSYIGHRSLRDAQQQGTAPWTDEAKELSDYHVAVFRDAYPVAPGHLLFVPRYDTPGVIKDAFDYAYIHGLQDIKNPNVSRTHTRLSPKFCHTIRAV